MQLRTKPKGPSVSTFLDRVLRRDVTPAPEAGSQEGPAAPRSGLGLSSKLLVLTILFVMLAEVLIFLPSVANFRIMWLTDRLTAARLASLAADAVPDHNIPEEVRTELLSTAKVRSVAIKHRQIRRMVLPPVGPVSIHQSYDLRKDPDAGLIGKLFRRLGLIADALTVFIRTGGPTIRVIGHPMTPMGTTSFGQNDFVEILLPESSLRQALVDYALNILLLSIIISMIAAALVYFALNRLFVQPMMRIKDNMVSFRGDPENASLIMIPSDRSDEIGVCERELAHLQHELRSMLNQRSHLAALGLAVSKINHDLRNLLASAQLMSDRLTMLNDPTVQSFAPKLIASLDRAINLCNDTLRYGSAEEAAPRRVIFRLADLVEEVAEGLGLPRAGIELKIDVDPGLGVDADRDHLYRVLNNLLRNAAQAIESLPPGPHHGIEVRAVREGRTVVCEVGDTGPGVPEKAKANLFQAFKGGARKGGSGLGLAIAAELMAAHGGKLELIEREGGAMFRLTIPDRLQSP